MNGPSLFRGRATTLLLLLSLAAGALLAPARAQDGAPEPGQEQARAQARDEIPWYQVEVIVFAYARPDTDGESWYENPGLPSEPNAIDLVTASADPGVADPPAAPVRPGAGPDGKAAPPVRRDPYLELPDDQNRLDEVYHILTISGTYRPLYHASWQQPGLDDDHALYVHLHGDRGGKEEDSQGGAAPAGAAGTAVPAYTVPEPAFDAMLRVRATHFLHVDVDAAYFPEDPSVLQAGGAAGQPAYAGADYVRLQESRRVRLKELHYFDHPLFGVIVQVTRLERDSEE